MSGLFTQAAQAREEKAAREREAREKEEAQRAEQRRTSGVWEERYSLVNA